MTKDDGGPAFPSCEADHFGMSLRDYFAAAAVATNRAPGRTARELAEWAYECADALLAEREKGKQ